MERLKLLLILLLMCIALSANADVCITEPDEDAVIEYLVANNINNLKKHIMESTVLTEDFIKEQGREGFSRVVETLAQNLLSSTPVNTNEISEFDKKNIIAKLQNGIRAGCASLSAGESDIEARHNALKTSLLTGGNSEYYFLLGSSNSLEANGSFSSGLEASFISKSRYLVRNIPLAPSSWKNSTKKVTGMIELTYSEIGDIDKAEDSQTDPLNPFSAGGGFFRFNGSIDPLYSKYDNTGGIGLRIGAGFGTQPDDDNRSEVNTRERFFAGTVFRANYGEDSLGRIGLGEVFIGFATDRFWNYSLTSEQNLNASSVVDEKRRIVIDGRLDLPGVFKSEEVRLLARLFADLPASGNGPGDLRISILLTVDIGTLLRAN